MPRTTAPDAPYPVETNVGSARFPLDSARIEQSDTWILAPPELRPWLLMLWWRSWRQLPTGTLPDDDAVIAAHIGMDPAAFKKGRATLMRGWWKAQDGKLYHPVLSELVNERLAEREAWRKRQTRTRHVTGDSSVSHDIPIVSHGHAGAGAGAGGGAIPISNVVQNPPRDASTPPHPHNAVDKIHKSKGNGAERWDKAEQTIDAKGREIGLAAKPGESYFDYTQRLWQAINTHKRGTST